MTRVHYSEETLFNFFWRNAANDPTITEKIETINNIKKFLEKLQKLIETIVKKIANKEVFGITAKKIVELVGCKTNKHQYSHLLFLFFQLNLKKVFLIFFKAFVLHLLIIMLPDKLFQQKTKLYLSKFVVPLSVHERIDHNYYKKQKIIIYNKIF